MKIIVDQNCKTWEVAVEVVEEIVDDKLLMGLVIFDDDTRDFRVLCLSVETPEVVDSDGGASVAFVIGTMVASEQADLSLQFSVSQQR